MLKVCTEFIGSGVKIFRKISIPLISIIIALSFSNQALALRCGSKLVIEGDHMYSVLKKCGKPQFEFRYYVDRSYFYYGRVITRQIVVDEWTYDRGSNRFPMLVKFTNGRVESIEVASD